MGSVLQTALGFVLIPLYTRYYSPQLYGTLTLILLVGTFAGAVFYLGVSSALARSYYDYESEAERPVVFSTSLYLTVIGGLLQIVLGVLAGPTLSRKLFATPVYAPHIAVALAASALSFVNAVFLMLLRFQRRSVHVVVLSVSSFLVAAALILYFLIVAKLGVMAPILGACLGQALLCAALAYLCRDSLVRSWSAYEVGVQLRYGLPTIAIGLTYYALDSIDRFLLQGYASLHDVGVYSLGYKVALLIEVVLILPFGQIWAPMQMQYRKDAHAGRLFSLVLTYYCVAGMLVAVILSTFARETVLLLARGQDYLPAYRVVPFVVLGHLAYGALNILNNGILFSRRVVYIAYVFSAGLLVNVALNVLFIPRLGYMAAAYTTLVSYVLVVVVTGVVSHRLYPIKWELGRLLKVLGSGSLAIVIGNSIGGNHPILVVMEKAATILLLLAVWYLVVLTGEERRQAALLLKIRVPDWTRSGVPQHR